MQLGHDTSRLSGETGFSLVEMLVCLALGSLLTALCLQLFSASLRHVHSLSRHYLAMQELRRIEELLASICRNSQARAGIAPLVVAQGQLLDLEKRELHVAHPIDQLQSSLSVALLEPQGILYRVEEISSTYCAATHSTTQPNEFLAVFPWGTRLMHLGTRSTRCSLNAECRCRSQISELDRSRKPVALLPVRDAFSLYLSTHKTLRRRALLRTEDQPLAYEIELFHIEERIEGERRLLHSRLANKDAALSTTCVLGPTSIQVLDAII